MFRNSEWIRDERLLTYDLPNWRRILHRRTQPLNYIVLPRLVRGCVVHGPNYFLPAWADTGVITVHDLSVFRFPETHPLERLKAFDQQFNFSIARSSHVITDSETIRTEVIAYTGLSPNRVTAVPLGIDKSYRPQTQEALAPYLRRLGLPTTGYGLCVSTLEPRKRINLLLKAWSQLDAATKRTYPLVIAGGSGWNNEELLADMQRARDEGWLIPLGYVEESLLPKLYAGAALFVYPSAYEGFGLPPLEAIAAGTPTIVANTSCLPEVTADMALLCDVEDVDAFSNQIANCLNTRLKDHILIERSDNIKRIYDWQKTIENTIKVYKMATT
jgi:alpha-1,3-rhamnosyl/mannosyltransferase